MGKRLVCGPQNVLKFDRRTWSRYLTHFANPPHETKKWLLISSFSFLKLTKIHTPRGQNLLPAYNSPPEAMRDLEQSWLHSSVCRFSPHIWAFDAECQTGGGLGPIFSLWYHQTIKPDPQYPCLWVNWDKNFGADCTAVASPLLRLTPRSPPTCINLSSSVVSVWWSNKRYKITRGCWIPSWLYPPLAGLGQTQQDTGLCPVETLFFKSVYLFHLKCYNKIGKKCNNKSTIVQ